MHFSNAVTTSWHRKCRETVHSRMNGKEPTGAVGSLSGSIMPSNGISLGAAAPHHATPLAPPATLPPPTPSHPSLLPALSPTSSHNLSAPLMVFFALTLAKLKPKRNNKRQNGSS